MRNFVGDTHPGIPKTPKARDTGRSPKSGRTIGVKASGFCKALVTRVWVLQPNIPTTYLPTGYDGFFDSIILQK